MLPKTIRSTSTTGTIDSHIKRVRRKFRETDGEFDMAETLYGCRLSLQRNATPSADALLLRANEIRKRAMARKVAAANASVGKTVDRRRAVRE
jgi:hypothetical protein